MYLGPCISHRNEVTVIILTLIDCFEKKYYNKETKQDLAISQAEHRENEKILDIKGLAG